MHVAHNYFFSKEETSDTVLQKKKGDKKNETMKFTIATATIALAAATSAVVVVGATTHDDAAMKKRQWINHRFQEFQMMTKEGGVDGNRKLGIQQKKEGPHTASSSHRTPNAASNSNMKVGTAGQPQHKPATAGARPQAFSKTAPQKHHVTTVKVAAEPAGATSPAQGETIDCPSDHYPVRVDWSPDYFPYENTWGIYETESGVTIYEDTFLGCYDNTGGGCSIELCLSDCIEYKIEVNDCFGDGLVPGYDDFEDYYYGYNYDYYYDEPVEEGVLSVEVETSDPEEDYYYYYTIYEDVCAENMPVGDDYEYYYDYYNGLGNTWLATPYFYVTVDGYVDFKLETYDERNFGYTATTYIGQCSF